MADQKISELTNVLGSAIEDGDEFVVVDSSANQTKAITASELRTAVTNSDLTVTGDFTVAGDLTVQGTTITVDSATAQNIVLGDNDKMTFGAGSDLQIYHNGSQSYIDDVGTGRLNIRANDRLYLRDTNDSVYAVFYSGAGSFINHNGNTKLSTTSTGVDVTGTVTADGLTVAQSIGANILLESTTTGATTGDIFGEIEFKTNDSNSAGIKGKIDSYSEGAVGNGALRLFTGDTTGLYQRINIASNGDISFYEDTGTTPKFFWDASAESLGIGTSGNSPWSTTLSSLRLGSSGSVAAHASSDATYLNSNAYYSDAWRYITNDAASNIELNGNNGDIRFHVAPTGTANASFSWSEAMRINSSGQLMVGTSSGFGEITVKNHIQLYNNDADGPSDLDATIGEISSQVRSYGGSISTSRFASIKFCVDPATYYYGDIRFFTNNSDGTSNAGTEKMRITSSGNVGIGTTSPSVKLHMVRNAENTLRIEDTLDSTVMDLRADSVGGFVRTNGSYPLRFLTNNTERMRITSAGNLLVGTTLENVASSTTETGVRMGDGFLQIGRSNSDILILNRQTSDGDIAVFRKDGTTVGSIGAKSDDLYINTGDTGIRFNDGNDQIWPVSSSGTSRDAAIDLGASSNRFKNVFLSEGVYLGGTGAANKLDDYEEGTWTPELRFGNSTTGITYNDQVGKYTKIGNLVHLKFRIALSNKGTATGSATILGMPFSPVDDFASVSFEKAGSLDTWTGMSTSSNYRYVFLQANQINLNKIDSNTTSSFGDDVDNTDFSNNSDIRFTITYMTSS